MIEKEGGQDDLERRVGLCARCRHVEIVQSLRGSTFYLCRLSATDTRFPRYPVLPVRGCDGFSAAIVPR